MTMRAFEQDFIQSRLISGPGKEHDAEVVLRAGPASSRLVGVVTTRRISGVLLFLAAKPDQMIAIIGPAS